MFGFIRKSEIGDIILQERMAERKTTEEACAIRSEEELKGQAARYELRLQVKDAELESMASRVQKSAVVMREARKKEEYANMVILKAKEMIAKVDTAYTSHAESAALVMTDLKNIRGELEAFSGKMLSQK